MCGLPVRLSPYWPGEAEAILLTRSSACDPEVVDKLEQYVAAAAKELGGKVTLVDAIRYEKGEGIEKKQEDFAAEVAAAMGK